MCIVRFSATLVAITMTALYVFTDLHRPPSHSGRHGLNLVTAKTQFEVAQSQIFSSKTKASPGRRKCTDLPGCIN